MKMNWSWLFILLCLAGGQLAACQPLVGSDWTLTSLNGHELIQGTNITLTFSDGSMGGKAGCNRYSLTVEIKDDAFIFDEDRGVVTDVLCISPEGIMLQEKEYVTALVSVVTYTLADGRLEMKNADGDVVLIFTEGLPEGFPG